jgi:hypothetical protein
MIREWRRLSMVSQGRVQNGVVVLDNGVRLPEGQEVTVLAPDTVPASWRMEGSLPQLPHSILDIQPVSVGALLRPLTSDDDLLGEMLERQP